MLSYNLQSTYSLFFFHLYVRTCSYIFSINGIGLTPVEFTPTGAPKVSAAVLRKMAGTNPFGEGKNRKNRITLFSIILMRYFPVINVIIILIIIIIIIILIIIIIIIIINVVVI